MSMGTKPLQFNEKAKFMGEDRCSYLEYHTPLLSIAFSSFGLLQTAGIFAKILILI